MPEDYTAVNIPLTFAVGATTASFTLQVTDDNLVEPNEIFNLKLVKNPSTLPDCVLVADDLADVIITDDDCKWTLSLLSMIFIFRGDMVVYWLDPEIVGSSPIQANMLYPAAVGGCNNLSADNRLSATRPVPA